MDGLLPPDLLREVRCRFAYVDGDPSTPQRIFLDTASGSLRLESMIAALAEQTRWPDQLGRASEGSRRAGEIVEHGLEDVSLFLGAHDGAIVPAMSGTHAMFRAVHAALGDERGGNVVTTNLEHACVYDSTRVFADAVGAEWRVADLDPATGRVPVEAILARVDAQTRLIATIHGSNVTGAVQDLTTLTAEARRISPNVLVAVDGVQYAPHAPVDVHELGVDAYVFSPYKVFCVKGIGFAWLSPRMSGHGHWKLRGKPDDDWMLGSPCDATYAAWSNVVDYLCWMGTQTGGTGDRRQRLLAGMRASHAHSTALLHRLLEGADGVPGLRRMEHVTLIGMDDDLQRRVLLALFNVSGLDGSQVAEHLRRRGIVVQGRKADIYCGHAFDGLGQPGAVRVSGCHYNTPDEIDACLGAINELRSMGADEIALIGAAPVRSGQEG
ncbi:MAG: hypothetical protein CMJ18_22855 [Phycisphaeraceae bacterium]|nr:hypothetical protein [Phycisphaeraceae bacterium]